MNTYDANGGAARAANRLHRGLRANGIDAQMLVQQRSDDDEGVVAVHEGRWRELPATVRPLIESQPLRALYPRRQRVPYSLHWLPGGGVERINAIRPDIVNLHWLSAGFLTIESLRRIRAPIVWTLHDMWSFSGGCHYSDGCRRYESRCGGCPILGSRRVADLSRWVIARKERAWHQMEMTLVTPSRWLADIASKSRLFRDRRIEVIAYGLDLDRFRPHGRQRAREVLGLPQDRKLVLFGGAQALSDPRKGFGALIEALKVLSVRGELEHTDLVTFGEHAPQTRLRVDLPVHHLGVLRDDRLLALAYSAGDVFVAPSREDNLPNTVMEALACGTPCVAFDIGGLPDLIDHKVHGWLSKPLDPEGLAEGISWTTRTDNGPLCSQHARTRSESRFDARVQAARYQVLFETIIEERQV